ncbi:MAG: fluoride efflux transporter CrcB [Alphaproteobacteria bacterium]|nr:fluoride efflux transporter CrcB [Alphaproteobacteria bacterium]
MNKLFLVALGGAIGSLVRYGLSNQIAFWIGRQFPWPILAVNILGCLAAGCLSQYLLLNEYISQTVKLHLFLIVGVLGGLTTFSGFALDTFSLIQRGAFFEAVIYILLSVILCLGGALLGILIVNWCYHG